MAHVDFDDVTVIVDDVSILQGVSLAVPDGHTLGIIGPNGSGKSTLLRCLYRAMTPTSGAVAVDGRDVTAISMRENARQVAALTQSTTLDFEFTVTEVVTTGRLPHHESGRAARQRDREICAAAMDSAGVHHLRHRVFSTLSGGEAQRVLIARAFAQEPKVLVLDEPTNHLDVRHQYAVLTAARSRGVTTIAALHDLNIAAQYCDRLAVVCGGGVVATGTPREVLVEERIREWFGIGCHVVEHPRHSVPQVIFDEGK